VPIHPFIFHVIQRVITAIILCFSLHFIIVLSDSLIATARVVMFWSALEEGEWVGSAVALQAVKKLNTRLLNSFYQAMVLAAVTGFLIIAKLTRRADYYAVAATMNVCGWVGVGSWSGGGSFKIFQISPSFGKSPQTL